MSLTPSLTALSTSGLAAFGRPAQVSYALDVFPPDFMTDFTDAQLSKAPWMKSRIPASDALAAMVPEGANPSPAITDATAAAGSSRWYPLEGGGHRVLIRYEGGAYDPAAFTIAPKAWDHEHCDRCGDNIPAMTLCWVTERDPYVLLCANCHNAVLQAGLGE